MHRFLALIAIVFCLTAQLTAQCSGNLGENIFTDGDFGSGSSSIPSTDPGIAPGYTYSTNPPPNDGSYTITNNTSSWGSFAEFWSDIGDNSPDPNGYMMVVNASFTPGLFYEQEVNGLCENTLYVFSADIYNIITGDQWIKPNVSFLLNGDIAFETGDIPDNEQWITYGFTFTTAPGQTSVTLALANNAPGGNGNDLALDNITFRPCGPEALILPTTLANICEDGEPLLLEATINGGQYDNPVIQWQQSFDEGLSWQDISGANGSTLVFDDLAAGLYYYRYLLANAPGNLQNPRCRVISNTKVVNVIPKFYTIVDTLCAGLAYPFQDRFYDQTGVYVDSLLTVLGCDSIVTLDLTIVPDPGLSARFTTTDPSCSNLADGTIRLDTVFRGALPYRVTVADTVVTTTLLSELEAGDYRYTITDRFGCALDTSITLTAPPAFTVELGTERRLELGQSTRITAVANEPVAAYAWRSIDSIPCPANCATIDLTPSRSGFVHLSAIADGDACIATDSVLLIVEEVRKVYIPNAFSPNGDGINDHFSVFTDFPNVQQIVSLAVYDRWGAEVFRREDLPQNQPEAGWDGRHHDQPAGPGVYTYSCDVRFLDDRVIRYTGSFNLLR